jgi:pilus assembly protein FimV
VQEVLIPASRAALFCALAAFALPAHSVVLGDIEVRSALGERLDARIPVTGAEGQVIDSKCFSLVRDAEPGIPVLADARLTIEHLAGAPVLRVRTSMPVFEPALLIRVRATCPAGTAEAPRQYTVLLDPRPGSSAATSPPVIAATLNARPGDTLEAIAAKVVRGRPARRQYLAAIRELNPSLAALGPNDPLPEGAAVALPDLRTYASIDHTTPPLPSAATELAAREPVPPKLPVERKSPPRPVAVAATTRATAPPAPAPAARAASKPASSAVSSVASNSGFVLKLSSSEVDLSRSRQIDDRMRAQLRERLLVLDNDDQVAEVLSMRNSLKQLEARVVELQLKLAQMPASLAARTEPPPASATPAPAPAPAKAPAARAKAPPVTAAPAPIAPPPEKPPVAAAPPPAAMPVEPPAPEVKPREPAPSATPSEPAPTAKAAVAQPEPVPPSAPAAAPSPPAASTPEASPPKSEAVAVPSPRPSAKPGPAATDEGGLSRWLWGLVLILVALATLLGLRLWRRRQEEASQDSGWATDTLELEDPAERTPEDDIFAEEPIEVAPEVHHEDQPEPRHERRREMTSDADLVTRLPQNSSELRRRYIEERFPEIINRTVTLDDPNSVVKGARLFYEDGAVPRAVELLQFSIEEKPGEVKTWLALFEILRLERLTGEFATLARRFQEHHGKSDYWAKVQYFGREIDPGNPLYKEAGINTLETIGPSEARRLAAASASFDPIAENWLNAPMDFENEVLANDLRMGLMIDASLTEQDLIPNPMPALRNIEMFTVA